jgi:hypothetical protein
MLHQPAHLGPPGAPVGLALGPARPVAARPPLRSTSRDTVEVGRPSWTAMSAKLRPVATPSAISSRSSTVNRAPGTCPTSDSRTTLSSFSKPLRCNHYLSAGVM